MLISGDSFFPGLNIDTNPPSMIAVKRFKYQRETYFSYGFVNAMFR